MSLELLTPHFQRREFTVSETAARNGILNVPPSDEIWANLLALSETVLEPARTALGPIRILSGYRSPGVNRLVGGAKASQHIDGEAADIIGLNVTLGALMRWIKEFAPYDQLIAEFGSWIHVSHKRFGEQRGNVLLAVHVQGRTVYTPLADEQIAIL